MSKSVINDAVHGVMYFSSALRPIIKAIVDTPEFQRLRYIKQLAVCDFVFPTANHTRFSHCLGTAFIASKICETPEVSRIFQKYSQSIKEQENKDFKDDIIPSVIIAALLHDIGHGAFSHAFEKIYDNDGEGNGNRIDHEQWTINFLESIKNQTGEINAIVDWELVEFFISKESNKLVKELKNLNVSDISDAIDVAGNIISSQLDADRLDYLLRDSLFCGVPYGSHNLEWIISNLTVVHADSGAKLGITKKGVAAVEDFLLSRRMMTHSIYCHPKVVACEHLLMAFLKAAMKIITSSEQKPRESLKNYMSSDLFNLLESIEDFKHTDIKNCTSERIADFKCKNFKFYSIVCDYDITFAIRNIAIGSKDGLDDTECRNIAKKFHERKLPQAIRLHSRNITDVKKIIKEIQNELKKQAPDKEYLVALKPIKGDIYKTGKEPLLVDVRRRNEHDDSGERLPITRPIEFEAPVLRQMSDRDACDYILIYDRQDLKNFKTLREKIDKIENECR